MFRRILAVLFIGLIAHGAPARAEVAPQDAANLVNAIIDEGLAMLNDSSLDESAKRGKIEELIRARFDIDGISQYVIGRYYGRLSPEQQAEFSGLYFDYVMELYFSRLVNIGEVSIAVEDATAGQNGDAMVATAFQRAGQDDAPMRVTWRVREAADALRVIDIQTEGVSLAVTQRSEFSSVFRAKGYDGLVEAMQKKIKQAKARS